MLCHLPSSSERSDLKSYTQDRVYKNVYKHLNIVKEFGLLNGKYADVDLPLTIEGVPLKYHTSCHAQITKVKKPENKKTRGTVVRSETQSSNKSPSSTPSNMPEEQEFEHFDSDDDAAHISSREVTHDSDAAVEGRGIDCARESTELDSSEEELPHVPANLLNKE